MIYYADGTEARVGDRVDYDGEPSVVEDVIDTPEQRAAWGVAERGLMVQSSTMGLVFEPITSTCWDAIIFLSRAE